MMKALGPLIVGLLLAAGCGEGTDANRNDDSGEATGPSVVVTTNILGEVVSSMLGGSAEVTTIMPPGASPHEFQASAQQVQTMREADLLVVNGANFEEGMHDVIDAAEDDGVEVYEAIDAVDAILFGHDEHSEDEREGDEPGHRSRLDPHFFTDPHRMADAAQGILDEIQERIPELHTAVVSARAANYMAKLDALDKDVSDLLSPLTPEQRELVTNHDVFGYFADRYDFDVIGTVIPSGSTAEGTGAAQLADLVVVIGRYDVPAVFADTSTPAKLAETLAAEVGGDVEVVELFSESLGESGSKGDTYISMVRTNAERIAVALA